MHVEIVLASIEHSNQIARLTAELGYSVTSHEARAWLGELLHSSFHCVFVAISNQEACGWLVIEKRILLESGSSAEITGLIVASEFRRSGIAKELVDAAENWARSKSLERVVVRSNVARDAAHRFYPSIGYSHSKSSHVYEKALDVAQQCKAGDA